MTIKDAKLALDTVINKSRVHMYKPIQVAEILFRHRTKGNIDLANLAAYRNQSKAWRDEISRRFVGSHSTSSAKFQDNLFEGNATPPEALVALGQENVAKKGIVEAYIYRQIEKKHLQLGAALTYVSNAKRTDFNLDTFLKSFREEPGLKRSIDKVFEIIVYALFSVLVKEMNVTVTVSSDQGKAALLAEFEDFARKVIGIDTKTPSHTTLARFFRSGVANAADRGLDMWANYGPAIQMKHLTLDPDMAEGIVQSITADRIVIVCKAYEEAPILAVVNQLGWKARVQSIVTEEELTGWYEKALRGTYGKLLGDAILTALRSEIAAEFPNSQRTEFDAFMKTRGYDKLTDPAWAV